MEQTPTFGLADIPEQWQIELNPNFVDQLDAINRPWPHEKGGFGSKRGRGKRNRYKARYWEAGYLHKSTRDRMTEEDLAGFKRRHSLFEKLWGRHRYKDYHFAKDDPRRYVDTGAWVMKTDVDVIREGIIIEDSEMERAIIGFRVGKFSNKVREIKVPRLPIIADEWWAWLMGFCFGAGNCQSSLQTGPNTRPGGWLARYIRLRANDEVIPRLLEVAKHTGIQAVVYSMYGPKYRGKGKLITGTRENIVLGWPEYYVLSKFGLPTAWEEWGDRRKIQLSSAGYKPVIPDWIKNDDDFMRSFIEGFMATAKVASGLAPVEMKSTGRMIPRLVVMPTFMGIPDADVKQFMTDIYLWFAKHGHLGFLRKDEEYGGVLPGKAKYYLYYTDLDFFKFILGHFNIYKSELRARLFARVEAEEDQILYEALRTLRSPDNVILGLLLEQPLTEGDIEDLLLMKPDGIMPSLKKLMDMGLVVKSGDYYSYYPEVFAERTAERYEQSAQSYLEKMKIYLDRLLFQCSQCNQVYINETAECNYCNGEVKPVSRISVVGRMGRKRMYDMYIANSLRGVET